MKPGSLPAEGSAVRHSVPCAERSRWKQSSSWNTRVRTRMTQQSLLAWLSESPEKGGIGCWNDQPSISHGHGAALTDCNLLSHKWNNSSFWKPVFWDIWKYGYHYDVLILYEAFNAAEIIRDNKTECAGTGTLTTSPHSVGSLRLLSRQWLRAVDQQFPFSFSLAK